MRSIYSNRLGAGLVIATLMAAGCSDTTEKSKHVEQRSVPEKVVKTMPTPEIVQPAAYVEMRETVVEDEFEGVDVVKLGREAFNSRDYALAARSLQRASDDGQAKPYDLYLLGLSLWKTDDLDRAEQVLVDASWKMEKFAKAPINLARVRVEQGNLSGAQEAIERALAIDPQRADAHNVQGRILMARGNVDAAAESFARASDFSSDDPWPLNNKGYLMLVSGRADEAIAPLEQAVALDESMATAWHNLALAREQVGDLIGAAQAALRASDLDQQPAFVATAQRLESLVPDGSLTSTAIVSTDVTGDGSPDTVSEQPAETVESITQADSAEDDPAKP